MERFFAVFRHTYIQVDTGIDVLPDRLWGAIAALRYKVGNASAQVLASNSFDAKKTAALVAHAFGASVDERKFSDYPRQPADTEAVIDAVRSSDANLVVFVTHKEMTETAVRAFCYAHGIRWSGPDLNKAEMYLIDWDARKVLRYRSDIGQDRRIEIASWLRRQVGRLGDRVDLYQAAQDLNHGLIDRALIDKLMASNRRLSFTQPQRTVYNDYRRKLEESESR